MTSAQAAAVEYVRKAALSRQPHARDWLNRVVAETCRIELLQRAMVAVASHARAVIHFHPDRLTMDGSSVAEGLLASGRIRNQFETGVSSGSRTAFAGGARDSWEGRLFGGAYAHATLAERPKYGALELIRYPDGPWPRFGSCYLVLRSAVTDRSTFTFSGSEHESAPARAGTIDAMESVFAALLDEISDGGVARVPWPPFQAPTLGLRNLSVAGLLQRIVDDLPRERADTSSGEPGRMLDSGIEAQVHGEVILQDDVEWLIADPSFEGTQTGERLAELSGVFDVPLRWHRGFVLEANQVPDDFRGPAMPPLARRIARHGIIDAAAIGGAESALNRFPEEWRDWGSRDETLQHFKQLWHVLVHYGAPARGHD